MIVKDVDKGSQGEVVAGEVIIGDKISVGEDENEEDGVVWKIYDEGRDKGEEEGK